MRKRRGKVYVVGIGPGSLDHLTRRAYTVLKHCSVIVGYTTYIDHIASLCRDKTVISGGMGKERERCEAALREALLGRNVALVSGGDPGIYGMAGIVLEIAVSRNIEFHDAIEIIPGIPASSAAGALVGAPFMNDFATVSLSDLLTPWEEIEKRLKAAAEGDFVVCLYNPKSKKRTGQIVRARDIFLAHRGAETPCAIIKNACRADQGVVLTTLAQLLDHSIDMRCVVIVGNSATRREGPWMITSRGYRIGDMSPGDQETADG